MKTEYEYLLHTWGGFYNEENIKIHKEPDIPYKWFYTLRERDNEVKRLKDLAKPYNNTIMMSFSEGYLTRFEFILQSHIIENNNLKIIENNLGYGFFSKEELDITGQCSEYMKKWKYDITANISENHTRLYTTLILK